MHPLGTLLPHAQALQMILDACAPVSGTERLPLVECGGRTLAEPVVATHDVPRFARAAMDGYAVRSSDVAQTGVLTPVDRVRAGQAAKVPVGAGQCVEIATGAPVPAGADAVVQVEWTRLEGERVLVQRPVRPGHNISPAGADVQAGTLVLPSGHHLTAARLAVAAAVGADKLTVFRRPQVAVVSTGSELRPAGTELGPGEIHDSNGPALATLFQSLGADVVRAGIVPDLPDSIRDALRRHAASDMVVVSGGTSAGEHDVVRDAVAAEGEVLFHGVRVKPGKPLLLGRVRDKPVIGLPGYPVSCLSDAYIFVVPGLLRIARRPASPQRRASARIAERVMGVAGRLWFLPVRLENGQAWPTYRESGSTTSLADAVGYVEVPEDGALEPGDAVEVTLF